MMTTGLARIIYMTGTCLTRAARAARRRARWPRLPCLRVRGVLKGEGASETTAPKCTKVHHSGRVAAAHQHVLQLGARAVHLVGEEERAVGRVDRRPAAAQVDGQRLLQRAAERRT